ncbi:hypothetical protein GH825_30320, partial [Bacillus thuringiensis]|nr:hypothetical protein [Bacillus thuringiensis]
MEWKWCIYWGHTELIISTKIYDIQVLVMMFRFAWKMESALKVDGEFTADFDATVINLQSLQKPDIWGCFLSHRDAILKW